MIKNYLYIFILVVAVLGTGSSFSQEEITSIDSVLPITKEQDANVELTKEEPDIEIFSGKDFKQMPWKHSIMFNKENLENIYTSVNSRISGKPPIQIADPNTGTQPVIAPVVANTGPSVAPAFHLNSILYYGPQNWTIWVNKKRIRRNTQLNSLQIGKVTRQYVEFIWTPQNLNVISPNWIAKVDPIDGVSNASEITAEEVSDPVILASLDNSPKTLNEMANNIQDVLSDLKPEDELLPDFEEVKMAQIDNAEKTKKIMLDLPPLYAQEDFSLDISKLRDILQEEKSAIIAKQAAENAVKIAREVEKVEGEDLPVSESYDAYLNKEIPFLWEYKSPSGDILVDTINGIVKFRIGMNQTFVSRSLQISEGYVASTKLSATTQQTEVLETRDLENAVFDYGQPTNQ